MFSGRVFFLLELGLTIASQTSSEEPASVTDGSSTSPTVTASTRALSRFAATSSTSPSGRRDLVQLGYLKLNRDIDPTIEDLRDKEELRVAGRIKFAKYWSMFGATVLDLTDKREDPLSLADGFEPVRNRLGIAYEDECLELGLTWRRDYERIGAFRKGSTFGIAFGVEGARPLSLRSAGVGKRRCANMAVNQGKFTNVTAAFRRTSARALCCGERDCIRGARPSPRGGRRRSPPNRRHQHSALRLPENPQVFGTAMPSVVKATAIVNGTVITQTDIDQRLGFAGDRQWRQDPGRRGRPPPPTGPAQPDRRNAADPGGQERKRSRSSRRRSTAPSCGSPRMSSRPPSRWRDSSNPGIVDQIDAPADRRRNRVAAAAARQDRKRVSVGDDEVKAVIDKLNASKGTEEYHVGEIFLSATPATRRRLSPTPNKILEQLQERSFLRGLRAAIFRSVDRGGRRRSRLGPAGTAARAARRCVRQMAAGHGQQPDSSSGAAFRSSPSRTPARC